MATLYLSYCFRYVGAETYANSPWFSCSMTSLYNQNYLQSGVGTKVFTTKIFTSWDYGITDKDACAIKQQSIATDIEVK